jgi:hypothetical protein
LGATRTTRAALLRLSQGSFPTLGRFVDRDVVVRAQRGDALARPAVTMACDEAVSVEDAGDDVIAGD